MQKTLSQSLFQTLFVGIVIASLLIIGAVWRSANTLVVQNIDHNIVLAEKVFDKVVADRQAVIRNVSKVLSRSFDFRRAVGTENIPSIEAAFTAILLTALMPNSQLGGHNGIANSRGNMTTKTHAR